MKNNQPVTQREYELKQGSNIISRTDKKGILTDCNEEFVEASGFTRQELVGKSHNVVRHPDMPEEAFRDLWDTLKRGRPWAGIVKNRRQNGDHYWVRATVTPMPDGNGYTSIRSKPNREEVQAAEKLYQRMRDDKNIRLDEGSVQIAGIFNLFKNVKVAHRLLVMAILPVLFAVALLTNSLWSLHQSNNSLKSVYEDRLVALDHLSKINDLNQMSLVNLLLASRSGTTKATVSELLAFINQNKTDIDATWSEIMKTHIDDGEKPLVANHIQKRDAMWALILQTGSLISAGNIAQANTLFDNELKAIRAEQENSIDRLISYQGTMAKQAYEEGVSRFNLNLILSLVVGIFGTLIVLTIAGLSMRYIKRSLMNAGEAATAIANGDLTKPLPRATHDEIGDLVSALSVMRNALHELLANMRDNVEIINHSSAELTSTAKSSAKVSEAQADAASSMAAAVEQMTVSIDQVEEGARETHKVTQESAFRSDEGAKIIHSAAEEMERIAEAVRSSAKTIRELEVFSVQISSIAGVIKEIADQTNLLALNAAIEAARAGEQGRGFAVVADEVRKLAERTAKSTTEISDMVVKIREGTQQAAQEMESGVVRVNDGVELARKAGESMKGIREGAEHTSVSVNEMTNALKEQTVAAREIAQRVEEIAQGADLNKESSARTAVSAHGMETLAKNLLKLSERFRIA
ncbi:MAG: methyl-accepting chemotaxis protein [Gallionella sp.]